MWYQVLVTGAQSSRIFTLFAAQYTLALNNARTLSTAFGEQSPVYSAEASFDRFNGLLFIFKCFTPKTHTVACFRVFESHFASDSVKLVTSGKNIDTQVMKHYTSRICRQLWLTFAVSFRGIESVQVWILLFPLKRAKWLPLIQRRRYTAHRMIFNVPCTWVDNTYAYVSFIVSEIQSHVEWSRKKCTKFNAPSFCNRLQ